PVPAGAHQLALPGPVHRLLPERIEPGIVAGDVPPEPGLVGGAPEDAAAAHVLDDEERRPGRLALQTDDLDERRGARLQLLDPGEPPHAGKAVLGIRPRLP